MRVSNNILKGIVSVAENIKCIGFAYETAHFIIWESETKKDFNFAVAISKQYLNETEEKKDGKKCFSIYVNDNIGNDQWYEETSDLSPDGLYEQLRYVLDYIERYYE